MSKCWESVGGFWKKAKIILALSFLLLIGTSFSVYANLDAPIILPLAEGGGDQLPVAADGDGYQSTDQDVRVMLPLIRAGENQLPVAADDNYQTSEDTKLEVNAAKGVLANDSNPASGPLQAVLVDDVSSGALNLNADGSFDYTPNPAFSGQDSFTYRASDGSAVSNLATVTLTVNAVNNAPVAVDDAYQAAADTELVVSAANGVLANDSDPDMDPLQAVLVDDVSNGVLNLSADGSFDYTPDPDFNGQDSFTYRATDGSATSETATVTLTVAAVNNAPVAVDDSYQTAEDTPLVVNAANGVLANDSDPDMDPLQAVLVSGVSNGVLNLNADGSFDYTPDSGFDGRDGFTYQADDGAAVSNTATVTIIINPANRAPKIVSGVIAFTKKVIGTGVDEAHSIVAADLDGDGDIDPTAATDFVDGQVFWYENVGNGDFVERLLDADLEGAYPSSVGDVDGDGDPDPLAAGYLADTFVWYRNDGGGNFTRQDIDTAADGAHSIVTVDMDDDGDMDLVTSSQDANIIAWYENDGANNFTERIIDSAALQAKRAEAADMDGDGDMDVVAASSESNEIAWHENDGNQNFTKRVIDTTAAGAYYVSPADIDSDGDMDVFSASRWRNTIAWHRNDGAAGFITQLIDINVKGARTVIAADMDGDGDVDALATSVDDDTIIWYENDGSGKFTKQIIDQTANGAYGLFTIDMDYDGDVDVLSASRDAGEVAIHTQIRAHAATVDRGGTLVIDSTLLRTIDVDDGPTDLTYTIIDAPKFGEIRVGGAPVLSGGSFTQDDVDKSRLTYVHDGVNGSPDEFSFTVADGGENGVQPATGVFSFSITG